VLEAHIRAIVQEEFARLVTKKEPDEYLSTKEVAELTGLSVSFFEVGRSMSSPGQPPYHKIGRRVLYRRADVLAWLENRRRGHK
jgi:excisionase family DNA binding protein